MLPVGDPGAETHGERPGGGASGPAQPGTVLHPHHAARATGYGLLAAALRVPLISSTDSPSSGSGSLCPWGRCLALKVSLILENGSLYESTPPPLEYRVEVQALTHSTRSHWESTWSGTGNPGMTRTLFLKLDFLWKVMMILVVIPLEFWDCPVTS